MRHGRLNSATCVIVNGSEASGFCSPAFTCARADASVSARRPSVRLAAYDADTIEIDVGVEIATSKPEEVEVVRNRLMLAFASALRENGVAIASIRATPAGIASSLKSYAG